MSTGDVRGSLRKLDTLLRAIKYPRDVDYDGLSKGDPSAFLPIVNFTLTSFSPLLAEELVGAGLELTGKTDLRFTDTVYKVLRDIFQYKPVLSKQQFLQWGFSQRKICVVCDVINLVLQRYNHSKKTRSIRPASQSDNKVFVQQTDPDSLVHSGQALVIRHTDQPSPTRSMTTSHQSAPHPSIQTTSHQSAPHPSVQTTSYQSAPHPSVQTTSYQSAPHPSIQTTSYQSAPHPSVQTTSYQSAPHPSVQTTSYQSAPHPSIQTTSYQSAPHPSIQTTSHQSAPHPSIQATSHQSAPHPSIQGTSHQSAPHPSVQTTSYQSAPHPSIPTTSHQSAPHPSVQTTSHQSAPHPSIQTTSYQSAPHPSIQTTSYQSAPHPSIQTTSYQSAPHPSVQTTSHQSAPHPSVQTTSHQSAPHPSVQTTSHQSAPHPSIQTTSYQSAPHPSIQTTSYQSAPHPSIQTTSYQSAPHPSIQMISYQSAPHQYQEPTIAAVEGRLSALESQVESLLCGLDRLTALEQRCRQPENKSQTITISREEWENMMSRVTLLETQLQLNITQKENILVNEVPDCHQPKAQQKDVKQSLDRIANLLKDTSNLLMSAEPVM